jgi:membrane protein YdbS with pleckstrin-like domain
MNESMLDHLQMLVLSAVFNPLFLLLLLGAFIFGRILGTFMPWYSIGRPMVILFCVGLVVKLFVFPWGYDLYFMLGFPFIAGIWGASHKWHS